MPKDEDAEKRVTMKLRGILVDSMLEEIAPEACLKFATQCQNNKKTLCVSMLEPSRGMLKASLQCCKQFSSDTAEIGCVTNPHDACGASKIISSEQHALTWHADYVKSVRISLKANDELAIWREEKCKSDDLGHAKVSRTKRHDCLGMALCHHKKKEVLVGMMGC